VHHSAAHDTFDDSVPSSQRSALIATPTATAYGRSHVGRKRSANEDSFAVLPQLGLYMVADGMGGAAAGEVASRTVVELVRSALEDATPSWPRLGEPLSHGSCARRFVTGIKRASRRIHDMARADPSKEGMGTTFAGLLTLGECAVIAHVGDSRVYRLRGGKLELLTRDHSLLNEYLRAGLLSPEEIKTFPLRSIITRAVGVQDTIEVDARIVDLAPGDVFLLSSDGLHGELDDDVIEGILQGEPEPCLAAVRLINRANEAGGSDNITVVVVRWDPSV
jgi:protein phosphatase